MGVEGRWLLTWGKGAQGALALQISQLLASLEEMCRRPGGGSGWRCWARTIFPSKVSPPLTREAPETAGNGYALRDGPVGGPWVWGQETWALGPAFPASLSPALSSGSSSEHEALPSICEVLSQRRRESQSHRPHTDWVTDHRLPLPLHHSLREK